MGMATVIPLAVLLQRGWAYIGGHFKGRKRVFAEIGLILLIGPLPSVFYPALFDGRSFNDRHPDVPGRPQRRGLQMRDVQAREHRCATRFTSAAKST